METSADARGPLRHGNPGYFTHRTSANNPRAVKDRWKRTTTVLPPRAAYTTDVATRVLPAGVALCVCTGVFALSAVTAVAVRSVPMGAVEVLASNVVQVSPHPT